MSQTKDYRIRHAKTGDYENLLDFGNYVFHIDFKALLPKLYDGNPERAQEHILVTEPREQGESIRAMVGSFWIPLSVAGKEIKVRGIGTVSVHPYDRGKGYMKLAMHRAIEEAKAEGVDFMVLSGRRQRYQHYGFDTCASHYTFTLTPSVYTQLTRFGVEGITSPVSVEKYRLLDGEESAAYEKECRFLYESQPVFAQRKNFFETARSWKSEVRVLLKDGIFAGYAVFGNVYGRYTVNEILLNEPDFAAVLAVYREIAGGKEAVTFILQPFQEQLIHTMTLLAEDVQYVSGYGINVFNFAKVAAAFLQVKADTETLMNGSYVFRIPGEASVRLQVKDGKVSAENVSEQEKADITLSHLQMMNFLFAPSGRIGVRGGQPELEKNWLPIPVCFSEQDNV